MKKLISLLLAAAMAMALASCGGHGTQSGGSESNSPGSSGSTEVNAGEAGLPASGTTPAPSEGQPSVPSGGQAPSTSGGQVTESSGTVSADPILVSNPMDENPLKYDITEESVYLQDLYEFMGSAMTVELPDREDWQDEYVYYSFTGNDANVDDIEEYINVICGGDYNLELVDKTVKSYDSVFVSYAVNYTGTGHVDSTMEASFSDIECNLSLYYTQERGRVKGALIIPSSMEVVDLGLRRGGGGLDLQLGGASADAGLYLMPDGSYQTDDGRLSVKPGEAVILRDGDVYTADAEFDRGKTEDHLWVRNFYRDETIFFSSPVSRLMTGDIFTMRDLYYDGTWAFANAEDFDSYRHDTAFLGLGHDGDFVTPRAAGKHPFEDVTVRVMYWEPDVVGVYYIYAKLSSAPYEIEALIAPSLSHTEGYTGADNEFLLSSGKSIELSPSRKYSPNYEVFTWEIVDGAGVVELANTTSASCTVTARRAGTAVVRVTYSYGIDEPNVLTGIVSNAGHTETTEYRIYVE